MNSAIKTMLARNKTGSLESQEQTLKEIIQEIALLGLWRAKFFEHAAFYGGTALRIFHGLDRFSEDLDFSLIEEEADFSFASYFSALKNELVSFGFDVSVDSKTKARESSIDSAFIKANTMIHLVKIGSMIKTQRDRVLKIKIEIDTMPPLGAKTQAMQHLMPIPFAVRLYDLPSLFAGKLHAALCRTRIQNVKGRDWYDFLWYVGHGVAVNLYHLEQRMRQSGHYDGSSPLNIAKLKLLLQEKIESINLEVLKIDVRPFVSDTQRLDAWSKELFLHAINSIRAAYLGAV